MVRILFLLYLGNRSKSDPCSYELFCLESHILSFPEVLQIRPESPCMLIITENVLKQLDGAPLYMIHVHNVVGGGTSSCNLEVCCDKVLLFSSPGKHEGLPAYFLLHLPSCFLKMVAGFATELILRIQRMFIAEDYGTITSKSCRGTGKRTVSTCLPEPLAKDCYSVVILLSA